MVNSKQLSFSKKDMTPAKKMTSQAASNEEFNAFEKKPQLSDENLS